MSTEDDLFIALRAMTFEEALDLSISITDNLPFGMHFEEKEKIADAELERYGWSYKRLCAEYEKRRGNSKFNL